MLNKMRPLKRQKSVSTNKLLHCFRETCPLGTQNCLNQWIGLIYIKDPSSYSCKPSFIDCRLLCILFTVSKSIDPETFTWVC